MTNILFTTPELEHPPKGGPKLRIENSIKALSRVAELVIASRVPIQYMGGERAVSFYKNYCKRFVFLENSSAEVHAQQLLKLASQENVDVIWLGYGNISYEILFYLKKIGCQYPIVIDTDSVWSRFLLRGLPYQPTFENRLEVFVSGWVKRWEEFWGTQLSNATTAVSNFDAEYYKLFTKRQDAVHVFSNVIDMDNYRDIPHNPEIKSPCIYLAGTFGPNSPMEEAALWIITEVLPLALLQIPTLHFYVVGVGATDKMKAMANSNVTITGPLESVLPYLGNANVSVVPLKYESGTRFKIMEAAACRIPIVSTKLGAEGIPLTHGRDILIADEPEAFSQAIVLLLQNPAYGRELADNCFKLITDICSITAATKEAETILHAIADGPKTLALRPDSSMTLVSHLAYRMNRSTTGLDRVTLALSLFQYLMEQKGSCPLFVEGEELRHTEELLREALTMAPDHILLNEAVHICSQHLHNKVTICADPAEGKSIVDEAPYKITASEIKSDPGKYLDRLDSFLCQKQVPAKIHGVHKMRALCLIALSRLTEAKEALDQELVQKPDNPELTLLLRKSCLVIEYEGYAQQN